VAHCFYFLHITCFLFSGRVADHWRWGGIATSEAYIWDSAPCATYLCLCLRVKFSVRGWDEARDGAYGPPSMSGRQIFVCGACVLARRRVLLRLNRTQNIAKKKKNTTPLCCDSRNNDEHETKASRIQWAGCREPRKSFFGAIDQTSFLPLL
jgi:hypothetical protein